MAKRGDPKNRLRRKGNPWSRIVVLSLVLLSLRGDLNVWPISKAARHFLERLCEVYTCPSSPEPGKTYVESALGRIRFLRQADFETALWADGMMGSDRTTAFTSRTEPRIIYFNLDDVSDLGEGSPHYHDIITGLLEHEVVHQAAISQPLPRPLTLTFANRTSVATHTAGLSLTDDWKHLEMNFLNEAATEWLAKDLREANFEKLLFRLSPLQRQFIVGVFLRSRFYLRTWKSPVGSRISPSTAVIWCLTVNTFRLKVTGKI